VDQARNFSEALIWSSFAPDNGNDLIEQLHLDCVFCTRIVHLDQRGSEPIKMRNDLATMLLGFRTKLARGNNPRSSHVDVIALVGNSFALHLSRLAFDVVSILIPVRPSMFTPYGSAAKASINALTNRAIDSSLGC
jgi:hypothetical protein